MTCLVALKHRAGSIIAADSALTESGTVTRCRKVFRFGNVILAMAGNADAIDETLRTLKAASPKDLKRWAWQRLVGTNTVGVAACQDEVIEWTHGSVEHVVDYTAVGCARDMALGVLQYARSLKHSPRAAVLGALRAAATHSGMVVGPYALYCLPTYRLEMHR